MSTAFCGMGKSFREIPYDENFDWHKRNNRWTVEIDQ
jgi:hypothetical protein